jgi:hypothetical protein
LQENGTRCSQAQPPALKTRHTALEHAARQELTELALDELREACPVAGLCRAVAPELRPEPYTRQIAVRPPSTATIAPVT